MKGIKVICVRTQYGLNAGLVLRACSNFGVFNLSFVEPQFRKDDSKLILMAAGKSKELLDRVIFSNSLPEVLSGSNVVIGFSRRHGTKRQPTINVTNIFELTTHGNVALLFGPEDNGLTSRDLELCSHLCHIPTHSFMPSMNLSHAVSVVLFSIFLNTNSNCSIKKGRKARVAEFSELNILYERLKRVVNNMVPGKSTRMYYYIKNVLSRSVLSVREVSVFHAFLREIENMLLPNSKNRESHLSIQRHSH